MTPPRGSRGATPGSPQEYPIIIGGPKPPKTMTPGPHVKNLELGWAFEDARFMGVPSRYGSYNGATWLYPAYPSVRVMEDAETLFLCVELGGVCAFGRTRRA
jgi:hypothetical protein